MTFTQIQIEDVALHLRLNFEDMTDEEKVDLSVRLDSAKNHIRSATALTDDELDAQAEFVMAVFMQCQSFYDNRSRELDKGQPNRAFDEIMNQHRINYIV